MVLLPIQQTILVAYMPARLPAVSMRTSRNAGLLPGTKDWCHSSRPAKPMQKIPAERTSFQPRIR